MTHDGLSAKANAPLQTLKEIVRHPAVACLPWALPGELVRRNMVDILITL
jgi:hypothetical protein